METTKSQQEAIDLVLQARYGSLSEARRKDQEYLVTLLHQVTVWQERIEQAISELEN